MCVCVCVCVCVCGVCGVCVCVCGVCVWCVCVCVCVCVCGYVCVVCVIACVPCRFAASHIGWSAGKVDGLLLPVIKKMNAPEVRGILRYPEVRGGIQR